MRRVGRKTVGKEGGKGKERKGEERKGGKQEPLVNSSRQSD